MAHTNRLQWLEAMRGLAACWVLIHHTTQAILGFFGTESPTALGNGYLGVDFFFVLSGFIIAFSSQALVTSGRGLRDYATARAIRIYVPYLPVGATMLLLYSVFPSLSQGTREELSTLTSLTLLPSAAPPALSVAWTLVHEIIFYAIFSLFFVSKRALIALMAVWAVAIVFAWTTGAHLARPVVYLLSPLNLCFLLGVGVAWATRRGVNDTLGIAAGVVGVTLVVWQAMTLNANRPLISFGFACLVIASRCPAALSRSPWRFLLTLGAGSYAIYLVHNPVISALVRVARGMPSPVAAFIVIALGALLAGLAYHFLWERRMLRVARTLARPGMGQPERPGAVSR